MREMASVHENVLAGGERTWRVMLRVDGKQKQIGFKYAEGAYEFKALVDKVGPEAALHVLSARDAAAPDVPTLIEYTARYLDVNSGLLTGIEPGTRAGYVAAAERSFLPMLGQYPVDAIQKNDVGRWVAWQEQQPSARRKGEKVAAKTVKNYHALLSGILAKAVEERIRTDNPAYRTRLLKGVKKEATFLTPEEFETILHFTPERHRRFLHFLAGSGLRWGEATALAWSHLNLNAHPATVRVERAWKKGGVSSAPVLGRPKSTKARRTVSIDGDVVDALGDPGPSDALIFPGQTGNHLWHSGFRENVWVKTIARAQDPAQCAAARRVPIRKTPTIHDLRHSHASWLIAGGAPLPYIQARLGHESITTTIGVYGHLQPDAHVAMSSIIYNTLAGVRQRPELEADIVDAEIVD